MRLDDPQVTLGIIHHNGSRGAPVPRFVNPFVLVTRPKAAADRFVVALSAQAGPFRPLICPAFETRALTSEVPDFEVAVFTSQAGVAHAPAGARRTAYCVGSITAQAAEAAGYRAVNADGDVRDLIEVILADAPRQQLVHIRGEVSTGDVTAALTAGGLTCSDHIAYRKQPLHPTKAIMALQMHAEHLIFPVFSSETASILADWGVNFRTAIAIAISPAVADAISVLRPLETKVSPSPNLRSMVATTAGLIA